MLDDGQDTLLALRGAVTGYGRKRVVDGVSLDVGPGEVVALIGHNGAGKSTVLKAIFGLLPLWEGRIVIDAKPVDAPTPRALLAKGTAFVPQGNRVFTELSVRENLQLAAISVSDGTERERRTEHMFEVFPVLKERLQQRAGTLSGGEKQMLALANALVILPRLLLLDEPSLGLAPPLISATMERIKKLSTEKHVSVLIVEQKVREVLRIADQVYVLRNGAVSFHGAAAELSDDDRLRSVYL